ncbi:MAG: hypothetical protein AB1635_11500 [Acidobacteriota bacterium]
MRPTLMIAALLFSVPHASAQSLPTLTGGPGAYTLSVPYLEYGSGTSRQAFSVRLDSADLSSFRLHSPSLRSETVLASASGPVTVSAGPTYRMTIPALSYGGRTYTLALTSTDLSLFVLDPGSVREVTPPGPSGTNPPTNVAVSQVNAQTIGSRQITSSTRLGVSWKAWR